MEMITLNDGNKIPAVGFGVFLVPNDGPAYEAVSQALKAGYRHIDTAAAYFNESDVGKAVKDSGIPREEIFITSKLWLQDYGYEAARKGLETSLEKLGLDYVDLYLLHQPYGDVAVAWKALEEAKKEGRVKSIGVSNMTPKIWKEFVPQFDTMPAVNQVELHPFFVQQAAIDNMKAYGVAPQAWGPLAEGKHGVFTDPELTEIGKKYGKSAAQVVLRWNVQRGVSIIPKSVHVERMEQNMDIWDFALTDEEMAKIATKDLGHSEIVDHGDPGFVKMLCGMNIHE